MLCGVVTTICFSTRFQSNIDFTSLHWQCRCRILHTTLQQPSNNLIELAAYCMHILRYGVEKLVRIDSLECRNLFAILVLFTLHQAIWMNVSNLTATKEMHARTHIHTQYHNYQMNFDRIWFSSDLNKCPSAKVCHGHQFQMHIYRCMYVRCTYIPDLMGDPLKRCSNHDWVLQMVEAVFCHVVCTSINDKIAKKRATSWVDRPPDNDFHVTEFRLLPKDKD